MKIVRDKQRDRIDARRIPKFKIGEIYAIRPKYDSGIYFIRIDKVEIIDTSNVLGVDFYGEIFTLDNTYPNSIRFREKGYYRFTLNSEELEKDYNMLQKFYNEARTGEIAQKWEKFEKIKQILEWQ